MKSRISGRSVRPLDLARSLSGICIRLARFLTLPVTAVVVVGALLVGVQPAATPARAATCANPVACENQKTGTPQSTWDVSTDDSYIQGFADPFSVNVGGTINFKIQTAASSYSIDIYRMGYYGGDGARLIQSIPATPRTQPACNTNAVTGLVDCGNWSVSASWNVPATAVSGVYFAHIYTANTTHENQIPFVVTNNASTSNMVFMTSDETWQAYNNWGGYSLYQGSTTGSPWCCTALDPGRATQVSYNRPFATRYEVGIGSAQDFFFSMEFPMIEFLEQNGYDLSYISQIDLAQPGAASMVEQHKTFVNAGHSEYWDAADRANLTSARNAGVNISLFTGNTMWWKTRWANSQFGNEPYRTLITYKESLDTVQDDPADPPTWTGAWRDQRFMSSGDDSGQPENALTGQLWMVNCCSYADQVQSQYSKMQLWKNTAVASLQSGQTYTMPQETLGYEWDVDVDNGFRPPGEIDMSKTCQTVDQALLTVSEQIGPAKECNSLTLYKAASGALVFDAGTVQWAWGLNNNHDEDQNGTDKVMQQATVNLFAMMGTQPTTLMTGLVPGAAQADTAPPTSTITAPAAGATLADGSTVTINGTASASGGVVAGVEVSTDGGSTWHPVTTMSAASASVTWSYTWSAAGSGSVKIMSRATDDDADIEKAGPGVTVTVNCPCGVFGNSYTPSTTSTNDTGAYELGMKFQSSIAGWVAGVRFYKGTGNNGTHTGSLWTASGTLLATGTFTNETASGWQSLQFTNAVPITANTTYVVSYWDPDGDYASEPDLFDAQVSSPPLTAVRSDYAHTGGGNGVYNAGGQAFPTLSYNATNYGVDVIFDATQPKGPAPTVTAATPAAGASSIPVSTHPSVTFSEPVTPSSASFTVKDASGNAVPGSAAFDSTNSVYTFTPSSALTAGTTYTATVSGITDQFGQTMPTDTYSFTTSKAFDAGGQCPCAIWPDVAPSGATDSTDASSAELGVQFQATQDGLVSGIRFYKEPDNTGSHTGTLWTASGTELATGTFTNESSQGWEELDFATPVAVTAGTTYVASYHTSGHYAVTSGGLSAAVTNAPLTALAGGGVYAYSSATTFPTSTYGSANYWVDLVFKQDTTPPTVTSTTPGNSATRVATSTAVTVTFSKPVKAGSPVFSLTGTGGSSVAGSASLNSAGTVLTFTPSSQLSANTVYQASVSGATSAAGAAMTAPFTWSFTTSGATNCPCTIWESDATPAVPAVNDASAVELGVKFQSSANGWIDGVRFYKGPGNTGTHTGSLWTDTGTLLAHGTFTSETGSGWQTLEFATAVPVTAGQTYVASYYAPSGNYSATNGYFASSAFVNAPLQALEDGTDGGDGVYSYGGDQFPTSSYGSSNYWVDPIFWNTPPSSAPGPTVTAANPINNQTSVPTNASVSATFSEAVQASTVQFTLTSKAGTSVPGTVSYNSSTNTATFNPSSALSSATTYTANISGVKDTNGIAMSSPYSWSFTSAQPTPPAGQCPCSIWSDSAQPQTVTVNEQSAVNLGVQFTSSSNGWITGIRFYKGPNNTGTHVGSLWSSSGSLLGQVTFTGESAAGWQQATFSTPIQVTAGTTYIASYFAPNGEYSATPGAFSGSDVSNPPLDALASSAVTNGNGVYSYGSSPGFPTSSYNGTNYWVDVVFTTTAP